MSSDVDICNLALARLGDDATVTDLDPPDGSAQAAACARFYPIARNSMQEAHQWGFCTKRATLALLDTTPPSTWQYAYASPNNVLNYISILSSDAANDYSVGLPLPNTSTDSAVPSPSGSTVPPVTGPGIYSPMPFVTETLDDGTTVIYTNQIDAVLRYTALEEDPNKFSPLFVDALAWLLASYLAGPIIKGEAGRAEAKGCYQIHMTIMNQAKVSDANQRLIQPAQNVSWMVGR